MTVSITIPNVSFSKFVSNVLLPYIDEAKAFYLYGDNFTSSSVNRALNPESTTATAVGNPTYSEGYAMVGGNNGFDLGYVNDSPFTYLAIADLIGGTGTGIMGDWSTSTEATRTMISTQTSTSFNIAVGGNNRIGRQVPNNGFTLYGGSFSGTRVSAFYHNGTSLDLMGVNYTNSDVRTGNLRVGAQNYRDVDFKIAAAVAFERVLSSEEIVEVYAYLKGLLATRGVAVL